MRSWTKWIFGGSRDVSTPQPNVEPRQKHSSADTTRSKSNVKPRLAEERSTSTVPRTSSSDLEKLRRPQVKEEVRVSYKSNDNINININDNNNNANHSNNNSKNSNDYSNKNKNNNNNKNNDFFFCCFIDVNLLFLLYDLFTSLGYHLNISYRLDHFFDFFFSTSSPSN